MFQIKIVEKIKTRILCSVTFFSKNRAVYDTMSKHVVKPEAADNMAHARCMLDKATRAQASTHARTHTHTEICNRLFTAFPGQKLFCKRTLILRCTYISSFVI
jgi:hypothetical protein